MRLFDDRAVFTAIVYVLTSGCAWRHLPAEFAVTAPTTHRRFQTGTRAGVWRRLPLLHRQHTPVEMADGTTKPISKAEIGDKILNAEPDENQDDYRRVDGIIVTTAGRNFIVLTIKTFHGPVRLTTTGHHRFWEAGSHHWVEALRLEVGDRLRSESGQVRRIIGIRAYISSAVTTSCTPIT
ncbi:hypothetical protein GCM10009635_06580 [Actinocatenispora thailandica]